MTKKIIFIAMITAMAFASFSAVAEEQNEKRGDKGDRGDRRGPSQEQVDACVGIAEGDSCAYIGRNDEEQQGVCAVAREDVMTCRGEGERKGKRGGRGDRDGSDRPAKEAGSV